VLSHDYGLLETELCGMCANEITRRSDLNREPRKVYGGCMRGIACNWRTGRVCFRGLASTRRSTVAERSLPRARSASRTPRRG